MRTRYKHKLLRPPDSTAIRYYNLKWLRCPLIEFCWSWPTCTCTVWVFPLKAFSINICPSSTFLTVFKLSRQKSSLGGLLSPRQFKNFLVLLTSKTSQLPYTGNFQYHQARCKMCQHIRGIKSVGKKLRLIVKRPKLSKWWNTLNAQNSMYKKQRMLSTYKWMVIRTDVWKNL